MKTPDRSAHNRYQRSYFDEVARPRLALGSTPYVMAHVNRMAAVLPARPGQRILEVGAGPGKFTLPMTELGWHVVANDLSPVLLEQLRRASNGRVQTLCCDIADLAANTNEPFDHAMGFFVLHHLMEFDAVFESLARSLSPGASIAFCEPVAWNPLYYVQIALTPNMRFAGEPALTSMRPGKILPAMARAGFIDTQARGYGYFPPFIKNRPLGDRLERWLDQLPWVPFPHAFQVFSARLPG